MTDDKRSSKRLHKRFVLRAAIFGEEPRRWSYLTIHNLSSSGILFTFDKPVYVGMLLYFKIDFPDRVIECMGRVRRVGSAREEVATQDIGASFEGLHKADKEYIDDFIRTNGPV